MALGLIALLACDLHSVAAHASETCHTPSAQTLIAWYNAAYPKKPLRYNPRNSGIYHPIEVFQTEQPAINWIGLAWLSPEWGALFAVNCDGKPVAALSAGAVGKITAGPALPTLGQTVMFEYVDGEGAGCVHVSIQIAALLDGNIISLWQHAYKQGMDDAGPGTAAKRFVAENQAVNLSDGGQTIHVTGKIQIYPYAKNGSRTDRPSTTRELPAEIYYWDAKHLHFLAGQRYPVLRPCVSADPPISK